MLPFFLTCHKKTDVQEDTYIIIILSKMSDSIAKMKSLG